MTNEKNPTIKRSMQNKMTKTFEQLANKNGVTVFNGKKYVLLQQAYADGTFNDCVYRAIAVCLDDEADEDGWISCYEVTWIPNEDWIDGDQDDEGNACDWGSPVSVERKYSQYNVETGRIY